MAKFDPPEKDIRDCVYEYLTKRGYFVWRDRQASHRAKNIFNENLGCPDILGMTKQGRFMGIEIKKKNGTLSIQQHNFLEKIKENGGIALVVTELDDLRKAGL